MMNWTSPRVDELPQHWRECILRLVQQEKSLSAEAVLKKCHIGLAMGFKYKGTVPEIGQVFGVGHTPCIKDLGEMAENFRSKERSRDLPLGPLDPEGLVQQVFIGIVAVPVSLPLFPDVDHAAAGDRPDKC